MATSKSRILVLGNCQAPGLTSGLKALLPDASIEGHHVGPHFTARAELLDTLDSFDVVISHIRDREGDDLFDRDRLADRRPKFVYMHPIVFTGFHPDIARVSHNGSLLEGPMNVFHSAIIAAAYSLGVDQDRVPRLFNALTYAKLGYVRDFETLKAKFLERHMSVGFDLAPYLGSRPGREPFMHVINHPRIDLLSAVSALAAARAGLVEENTKAPTGLIDELADDVQWPVYPELGRPIGVTGSMDFIRGVSDVPAGASRTLTLQQFVERSYQLYESTPSLEFDSPLISFVASVLKTLRA